MIPPYNKTCEWYTPQKLLDLIYLVMDIDLDPASPNPPTVKTRNFFTKEIDGLKQNWFGNVYLNPPYGRGIENWIFKLCEEFENSNVKNAIVLIPAKTDTKWFECLANYSACFCTIVGRINFESPNPSKNTGTFGSILVLLSHDKKIINRFVNAFTDIGYIWEQVRRITK